MFGISNQCRKADVKNYDGNIDACKYIKIIQLRKKKYEWKLNLKGQDYKQCMNELFKNMTSTVELLQFSLFP